MKILDLNSTSTSELAELSLKEIVTSNFHTADLFEKMGLDYCCGGKKLLGEALAEKSIPLSAFIDEFGKLGASGSSSEQNYGQWELDFLTQYIINTHHKYVSAAIPRITALLEKVLNAHGKKYPYLTEVSEIFAQVGYEMNSHMLKEERMLFPLIKYLAETKKFNEVPKSGGYGTIRNPINQMEREHVSAGGAMEKLRNITNNYSLPGDACTTFQVTYKELDEFEKDLHKHVHLENNILFPRAIELEEELQRG